MLGIWPIGIWHIGIWPQSQLYTIKSDLEKIVASEKSVGPAVNFSKCKFMSIDPSSNFDLTQEFPEIKIIQSQQRVNKDLIPRREYQKK